MATYKPNYQKSSRKPEPKQCYFCTNDVDVIDFKETGALRNFLTHQYKISPRKKTGNCSRHQRRVANAIKRARLAALIPFTQHKR